MEFKDVGDVFKKDLEKEADEVVPMKKNPIDTELAPIPGILFLFDFCGIVGVGNVIKIVFDKKIKLQCTGRLLLRLCKTCNNLYSCSFNVKTT